MDLDDSDHTEPGRPATRNVKFRRIKITVFLEALNAVDNAVTLTAEKLLVGAINLQTRSTNPGDRQEC